MTRMIARPRNLSDEQLIEEIITYCTCDIRNVFENFRYEELKDELINRGYDPGEIYVQAYNEFLQGKGYDNQDSIQSKPTAKKIQPTQDDEGVYELDFSLEELAIQDLTLLLGKHVRCFKVIGDSMIDADIDNQDLVFVDVENPNYNNQIVVGRMWGDKWFIKRYVEIYGYIMLKSENPHHKAIQVTDEMNVEILGIVKGKIKIF